MWVSFILKKNKLCKLYMLCVVDCFMVMFEGKKIEKKIIKLSGYKVFKIYI